MDAIPHDPDLNPRITGRRAVDEDLFRRKLGETSFLVWQILCECRNRHGLTTVTHAGMQRLKLFQTPTDNQIRTSLLRLRRLGLVRNLARHRIRMMRPKRGVNGLVEVWCMPRKVYGALAVNSRGRSVLVPDWVPGKLQKVCTHGGARRGAGRPRAVPRIQDASYIFDSKIGELVRGGLFKNPPPPPNSRTPPDLVTSNKPLPLPPRAVASLASQGWQQGCASRAGPEVLKSTRSESSTLDQPYVRPESEAEEGTRLPPAATKKKVEPVVETEHGTAVGGLHTGLPPVEPGTRGLPPYPSHEVCPPAYVPGPPRLPAGLSDLDAARWLAKAYRGAVESRYRGKRCWVLSGGKLERSKLLPQLVRAARLLEEHEIPPAAWAAFSADVWKRHNRGRPPVRWVYGLGRIEERQGWFLDEQSHYSGRRVTHGRPALLLVKMYGAMQAEVVRRRARTQAEIREVVDLVFPRGLYRRLVRAARRRAADDQTRINRAVARGEWMGW